MYIGKRANWTCSTCSQKQIYMWDHFWNHIVGNFGNCEKFVIQANLQCIVLLCRHIIYILNTVIWLPIIKETIFILKKTHYSWINIICIVCIIETSYTYTWSIYINEVKFVIATTNWNTVHVVYCSENCSNTIGLFFFSISGRWNM